jgi:two-component system, chemotaxis family, protein-glutamate methylesterase/glutaminase
MVCAFGGGKRNRAVVWDDVALRGRHPAVRAKFGAYSCFMAAGYGIVVIGASAGGVEAVRRIAADLRADLPAAVFVVLHVAPHAKSALPEILSAAGPLPAAHAVHGEAVRGGRIYVAPPDVHMTLGRDVVQVQRGPRENGARPAVDPLFRSAAAHYGSNVLGVVLTGNLDCGSAGLATIKTCGGAALVQDPGEATSPDMPRNAVARVPVDWVVPLAQIGPLISRLAVAPQLVANDPRPGEPKAEMSFFTCPACGGSMMEDTIGKVERFACHTGHRYTVGSLAAEQSNQLETALWTALRLLDENEAMAKRLAASSSSDMRERFHEKARSMRHHREVIHALLIAGLKPPGA